MNKQLVLFLLFFQLLLQAQTVSGKLSETQNNTNNLNTPLNTDKEIQKKALQLKYDSLPKNYFTIGFGGGYDFPSIKNNLPYIKYSGGFNFNANANYYWGMFGLGLDFDYLKSVAKNQYPTTNLFYEGNALSNATLKESSISRIFYGIGPGLKFQTRNQKFNAEVYGRIGLANISGGDVSLRAGANQMLLNAHNGFNLKSGLTAKAGLRFNFYFNQNFGIFLGGYYLQSFKSNEINNNGYYAFYRNFTPNNGQNNVQDVLNVRTKMCDCTYDSYGITAGITLRFGNKQKVGNPNNSGNLNKNVLTVNAIDSISKEKLPDVDVAIVNSAGDIIRTGTTNYFGVAVFQDLPKDDYKVNAKFYEDDLKGDQLNKTEFKSNVNLQKNVYYSRTSIIIKGRVTDCNTKEPLTNANIYAENPTGSKSTISDSEGNFSIKLEPNKNYKLYAAKALYFSEIKDVTATDKMRDDSPLFDLELCAEDAKCGNKIKLNNIYYDFNKATLRPEAIPELQKLLRFLIDNPTAKVEISSHTDSRGSDAYNLRLSDERAKSVVDYLVRNGINRYRLIAIGKGETEILNQCYNNVKCTDAEHMVNRRTEMRVICDDN